MKVLVTGARGFIGRAVLRALGSTEASVVAVDAAGQRAAAADDAARVDWVTGDLTDAGVRAAAIGGGVDAVLHLAAVPGGAAEADPRFAQRVNVEATLDLLREVALAGRAPPRVVYASTIAVYGNPLPADGVDDRTVPAPRLLYGAQKAMIEMMIGTLSRRGAIDGVSLRLPGIVARPPGPSGLKSAFMSELFHALRNRRQIVLPVSASATLWLMSVAACARNLLHALALDTRSLPSTRALALPALRVTMGELVAAVAAHTGAPTALVSHEPDEALEAAFGRHPPLTTDAADAAGFEHDGDLRTLVERALG